MFTGLLDTSVLWPSTQRDFLLCLAIEGMYRPARSSAISDELQHHEAAKLLGREVPAGAGAIVTENLEDFPLDPVRASRAVRAVAARSGRQGHTWSDSDVLTILEDRYGMAEAVALLREVTDELDDRGGEPGSAQ